MRDQGDIERVGAAIMHQAKVVWSNLYGTICIRAATQQPHIPDLVQDRGRDHGDRRSYT